MTAKEILKQIAETSDPNAYYELALTFDSMNYNKMLDYLYKSANEGYLPAIAKLAELYKTKPSLIRRLDDERCAELNAIACSLIVENRNEENEKIAYMLFRAASKDSREALQSLTYCRFEGIGVKKSARAAFEIVYANDLGNELIVFHSTKTNGFQYKPKKTKVAKSIKRKHQKKTLMEIIRTLFFCIFAFPAFLVLGAAMDGEDNIRNSGGYYVDEDLRTNAIGAICLMVIVSFIWTYIVCSGISILFLSLVGYVDNWKWGFVIGLPLSFLICKFIKNNIKSLI